MLFDSNDKKTKLTYLKLMVDIMHADGDVHVEEKGFIFTIAQKMGITKEELAGLSSIEKMHMPADEIDRMQILYHILFLMRADGAISSDEERVAKEIGFRLGIRTQLVEDLIGVMIEYLGQAVPPSEMRRKILPYLN